MDLQVEFSKTSIEPGPKMYIIRDIENINASAANSLLKFLEEHLPTQEIAYEHYFTNGLESAERIKEIIMKNIPPYGISTSGNMSF